MDNTKALILAIKNLDQKKIIKEINVGGFTRKVCSLCEHPLGSPIHLPDCPIEIASKIEV